MHLFARTSRSRAYLFLSIAILLLATGGGLAVEAGSTTIANTDDGTAAEPGTGSPVPYENETITTAYVAQDSGNLMVRTSGNHTIDLNVTAAIVGKGYNIDDDWYAEIPYITEDNDLYVIDRTGNKTHLADNAQSSKTALVATEFQGERVVIYENQNNVIQKVSTSGGPQQIIEGGLGGNAVLGVGDLTGNDKEELLYLGTSGQPHYYNSSRSSGKSFNGISPGSNGGGIGAGSPRDFDNDGRVEVPIVDGSPVLYYVGLNEQVTVKSASEIGKYPVGSLDVVGDSTPELLYAESTKPYSIDYVSADGSQTGPLTGVGGTQLTTTQSAGVSYVNGTEEPLAVANLTLVNKSGTLRGAFNSSVALSRINANITGPDGQTLSRHNFTESPVGVIIDTRQTTLRIETVTTH